MLNLRRIGGSDIPALVSLYYPSLRGDIPARYSAFGVWDRIVNQAHDPTTGAKPEVRRGKRWERPIFDEWLESTGRPLERWRWQGDSTIEVRGRDWQRISPDATSVDEELGEVKMPLPFHIQDFKEGRAPFEYEIQCRTYMEALDLGRGFLIALLGNEVKEIPIDRDTEIDAVIVECGEKFWRDHILTKTPPPIDGSEAVDGWLKRRHPFHRTPLREAGMAERVDAALLMECRREAKRAEVQKTIAEQKIKAYIGESQGLDLGDLGKITWTKNKDTAVVDWEGAFKQAWDALHDDAPEWDTSDLKGLLAKHTTIRPGPRVLRCAFKGEE